MPFSNLHLKPVDKQIASCVNNWMHHMCLHASMFHEVMNGHMSRSYQKSEDYLILYVMPAAGCDIFMCTFTIDSLRVYSPDCQALKTSLCPYFVRCALKEVRVPIDGGFFFIGDDTLFSHCQMAAFNGSKVLPEPSAIKNTVTC